MSLRDYFKQIEKEKEIEKKKKYYDLIQKQILEKKILIEEDIRKIKGEELNKKEKEKQRELMKNEIMEKLKEKYRKLVGDTNDINNFKTTDPKLLWKKKRNNNRNLRFEIFNKLFDYEFFSDVYPIINLFPKQSYHYIELTNLNNINIVNFEQQIIPNISNELSSIHLESIHLMDVDNESQISPKKVKNEISNHFISNIFKNEFITPMIETAVEISENLKQKRNKTLIPKNFAKKEIEVDNEVFEIINKIQTLISEEQKEKYNSNIEIPIQVILQEFFYDLIVKQHNIVNNCFILLLKNKFGLMSHLEFIRKIFLNFGGDIIQNMIEHYIDFKSKLNY